MGSSGHAKKQACLAQHGDQGDSSGTQPQDKKKKKRIKKLLSQLQQQIEFYFSDSNLQKDRFLKQEIVKNKDGYINIKTIADFNRMKQMTDSIELVTKAMKASPLLQLNDEENMVKRVAPLPEPRNVDAETIYVENLPPQADHDWLRKIFSQFGKVNYVSIPRFKHTNDIKGFAFIEFESSSEANGAVKAFRKDIDDKDNIQHEDHKSKRRKRSHSESEVENGKHSNKTERKRRRTTSESSADSLDGNSDSPKKRHLIVPPEQQQKIEEESSEGVEEERSRKRKKNDKTVHWKKEHEENQCEAECAEDKTINIDHEETPSKKPKPESDSNTENEESEASPQKKKVKKRKRKVKEKKETKLPHFRVIPKLEWMQLKQEYKKLQRESMQELKKQLQTSTGKTEDGEQKQEIPSQSNKDIQKKEDKSVVKELPFTPGVVLHFECSGGTDLPKSEIRARLTAHAPLAYIDVKEGTGEGYVRFHTVDDCTTVVDNVDSSSGLLLNKLSGEEEREYWRKINADRVARYQAKRQKKRGAEKVARKVDAVQVNKHVTHIRFDED